MNSRGALLPLFLLSSLGDQPRYTLDVTDFQGRVAFYNPVGDMLTSLTYQSDSLAAWDGLTTRPVEFQRANASGDGYLIYSSGSNSQGGLISTRARVAGIDYTLPSWGGQSTQALFINSAGEMVGIADTLNTKEPFIFRHGQMINLNTRLNRIVRLDVPLRINDDGVIYGFRSVTNGSPATVLMRLRPNGDQYDVDDLATLGQAPNAISANGEAVFVSGAWIHGSTVAINLGVPDRSYPEAINSSGQIVGFAESETDQLFHAFMWDGNMHVLSDLVPLPSGWTMLGATDLNEYGQIAARGFTGTDHKLLRLTPLPTLETPSNQSGQTILRIRAGARRQITLESSGDFNSWSAVKIIDSPNPVENVSVSLPQSASFFRITRAN